MRKAAQKEFVEMVDAGILVPHDEPAEWRSQSFPRAKPGSDPVKVRWVTDFRKLNACLERPVWGAESSSQIIRNLPPEAKYFASFDATSGFHQIRVDEASSRMMTIVTIYGTYRFTVLGQGICSAQDLFNYLTDGSTKLDIKFKALKNVDDFLLYGTSLQDLEEQIEKLMHFCKKINLKLAPSKFCLNTSVKFGGTIISAEKVQNNSVIFLDPPDKRILAVTEMERPKTRKELQSLTGMISSLRAWFPSVRFAVKSLYGATGNVGAKFIWTPEMQKDFDHIKQIFTKQIRLSPFDPKKKINLLIDGANGSGVGYVLYQHVNDEDPGGGRW